MAVTEKKALPACATRADATRSQLLKAPHAIKIGCIWFYPVGGASGAAAERDGFCLSAGLIRDFAWVSKGGRYIDVAVLKLAQR
jgi:hypothetical protein